MDIMKKKRYFIYRIFIFSTMLAISGCGLLNSFPDFKFGSRLNKNLESALNDLYTYQDESGMEKVAAVLEKDQENAYALALQAAFKLHQRNGTGALQDMNEAIIINPELALTHAVRATYYSSTFDFDSAEIEAKMAIEADPKLSYAYSVYGNVLIYREDLEQAQTLLEQALELEPDNIDAYHNLCRVHLNSWNFEQALSYINEAIEINPNLDFLYLCKGYSNYSLGNYDDAISDFTEAINLGTDDFYAYWYRAWLHSNNGDNEAALEDYLMAIELNPNDASSYNGAAYSMALLDQDLDKALEYIQISLQLRPESDASMDTKAFIFYQMGNYDDALVLFTELIRNGYTYSYYGRGKVFYEIENFEVAKSDFQYFLQSNPDSPRCDEVEQLLETLD